MNIEIITLIYRSTNYLKFIIDQVERYGKTNNQDIKVSFRIVANDPTSEVVSYLKENCNHIFWDIFSGLPNDYYLNNVYRAWNYAGMTSTADYICFINSDFGFSPDWLDNLIKHIHPNRILTSRLVESGKMPSGKHGISQYFGMTTSNYNENAFRTYAASISVNELLHGGLYMPLLISTDLFQASGGYPEGNVCRNGIGAYTSEVLKSGDAYYFEDVLRDKFGVHHYTPFDSIVYHFQEGEKSE